MLYLYYGTTHGFIQFHRTIHLMGNNVQFVGAGCGYVSIVLVLSNYFVCPSLVHIKIVVDTLYTNMYTSIMINDTSIHMDCIARTLKNAVALAGGVNGMISRVNTILLLKAHCIQPAGHRKTCFYKTFGKLQQYDLTQVLTWLGYYKGVA